MDVELSNAIISRSRTPYKPCGDGWIPLINKLAEDLADLDPNYRIDQIKEKFGGLRFYFTPSTDDEETVQLMNEMVSQAEAKASKTCEKCGAQGELRQTSWMKTLCDKHYSETL